MLVSPPNLGERISRILSDECGKQELPALKQAEEAFFKNTPSMNIWDTALIETVFKEKRFNVKFQLIEQKEERLITEKDMSVWFDTNLSRWGSFMSENLGKTEFSRIEETLRIRIGKGPLIWQWKSILFCANL
jgi:putative ATPase